jgi:hypothetical protein
MNDMLTLLSEKDGELVRLEQQLVNANDVIKELQSTIALLVNSKLGRGEIEGIRSDFIENLNAGRYLLTLNRIDELLGSNLKPSMVIIELLSKLVMVVGTRDLSYQVFDSNILLYRREGNVVGHSIAEVGELVFEIIQPVVAMLHHEFSEFDTKNVNGVVGVLNMLNDKDEMISQFNRMVKRHKQRII